MEIHLGQCLSTESLRYLDQASAITKKADAVYYLSYIDSLKGLERAVFLKALKEESSFLYGEHKKSEDAINEEHNRKSRERHVVRQQEEKEADEKFRAYWTEESTQSSAGSFSKRTTATTRTLIFQKQSKLHWDAFAGSMTSK